MPRSVPPSRSGPAGGGEHRPERPPECPPFVLHSWPAPSERPTSPGGSTPSLGGCYPPGSPPPSGASGRRRHLQGPLDASGSLADAVLVLDQGEPHVSVAG